MTFTLTTRPSGDLAASDGGAWNSESILAAIADFGRRQGRWPTQKDFRSDNGLPGYATLWRRFGSIATAVQLADSKGERSSDGADGLGDA